jgi:hypothetical protein
MATTNAYLGQGEQLKKPATRPIHPRNASFKIDFEPNPVTNEANNPVSAPIAIPGTAYTAK